MSTPVSCQTGQPASSLLAGGGVATQAAGREMVRLRVEQSQRTAEATVRRAATRVTRLLDATV
jgi:hypothetical protein